MIITSLEQLDDVLSQPSQADVAAMAELDGDLMILGVGGKMGPTLARRARRAADAAGAKIRVIGVSRFSSPDLRRRLEDWSIQTISADLLDEEALAALPETPNIVYMAARKFGTAGAEHLTWAMNTYLPGRVADRFRHSRIVAFSSGNVYPLGPVDQGGSTESTPPAPVGEYGVTALGRERMFHYFSHRYGTPVTLLRLNYAVELRYGVLLDIGMKVFQRQPVDLAMGHVNVIWQGDANSVSLRSFGLCGSPPDVLNVTGPGTLSVRHLAGRFGEQFGIEPVLAGTETPTALLNNAARCHRLFGHPSVSVEQAIEWTAHWIAAGGATHGKPTHFDVRDGTF